MQKRKQPTLRLSLLSCAIALAATSAAQSAMAVELCSGQASVSVTGSATGDTCALDTPNASLSVSAAGAIDSQVYVTAPGVKVSNAGLITAADTSAIYYDGQDLDGSLTNSGRILGTASGASYAYAYGLYMSSGMSGDLSNTGTIAADAEVTGYRANATAIDINGDQSGSLHNSGLIEASAHASTRASAYGIEVYGVLSGDLVNSGTIRGVAESTNSRAYVSTIYIQNGISGDLINSGTIEALAKTRYNDATAYALDISGGDIASTATFTNSGTVRAEAFSRAGNASAYAIYLSSGKLDTVFTNSGTVNATATSYGSTATAEAIYLNTGIGGSGGIINTGTISAIANGGDYGYATAIEIGSEHSYLTSAPATPATDYAAMSGNASIVNSGTILADASGRSGDGEAYAVYISGDLAQNAKIQNNASGVIKALARSETTSATATAIYAYDLRDHATILNNGLILAQANSTTDYTEAMGIRVGSMQDDASIINNSTLKAIASGHWYASATGIETGDLYNNASIINSGTIEVKAASEASSVTAYGLDIGSLHDAAKVVNNGTITVTAEGPRYSASAYGIDMGSMSGTSSLTNNGNLIVSAVADKYSGTAYGISMSSLSGDAVLTNQGKISVTAVGYTGGYAYGISSGSLGNNAAMLNKGSIVVSATDGTSYAYAYGLDIGSVSGDATLTNNGRIQATAHGLYDAYAYAYAIDMGSITGNGALTNTSLIAATASVDGTASASAYGITMGSIQDNAVLVNKGTIVATSTAKQYEAEAYGISMGNLSSAGDLGTVASGDEIDALTNTASGVISAYAEGETSATAYGISLSDMSGTARLTNDGSITATAVNHYSSSAEAYGISAGRLSNTAAITNNGNITVRAVNLGQTADDSAYAYGISAYQVLGGASITNTGNISASASAEQGSASAYGIYVGSVMSGTITNSGTINASASTVGEWAGAWGIRAGGYEWYASGVGVNGTIDNSGTINGAVVANYNYFYNCYSGCSYLGYSAIDLTNSGSITTQATVDSFVSGNYTQAAGGSLGFVMRNTDDYAQLSVDGTADFSASSTVKIYVDPKATLHNGDVLNDVIYAGTLTPNADGFAVTDASVFYDFTVAEDANSLDLTVVAQDASAVLASAGLTLTSSQAALVAGALDGSLGSDYAAFAAALNTAGSASEAARAVNALNPALTGAGSFATRVASAPASNAISARMSETGAASGDAFSKNAVWIKPFLGKASQDAANGVSGYDVDTTGFVIGIDGDVSDAARVGVAVASSQSNGDGDIASLDIDTTQFTLYGSYALGSATSLDADLSYGANSYDSSRSIGFVGSRAVANYDGTQLALGATLSHRISMSEKAALVPALSLRYSSVDIDGYTETGAGAYNLAVADTSDDAILVAAKAGYELTLSNKGVFLANLGLGYDTIDRASATAALGNGSGPVFVSNGIEPDSMLVTGGLGYRYVTSKNLEINAAYDLESRSDFLGQTLSVKFRMPF